MRVLLSESSSLTAREFITVLGRRGVDIEMMAAGGLPIGRFSRWCRAVHRGPAPSLDPIGYLRAVDRLMASGRFTALVPTHEQAWLFAVGRELLTHADPAVASPAAFDQVVSKLAFARTLDRLGLPQPAWRLALTSDDLSALGFPVWLKSAFSTAGRGVRRADTPEQALTAWQELRAGGSGGGEVWRAVGGGVEGRDVTKSAAANEVMVQAPAAGTYAQVQGVFDRGRLLGAAVSEQLAVGAGGSAAARISVEHPAAVRALSEIGAELHWHGGIGLDYFHQDGKPCFIECNPRITEPGNAAAAGVDLPALLVALGSGGPLPDEPLLTRPGVRTRSTLAIAIGTAERTGSRAAIVRELLDALAGRGPLAGSDEVLTPVLEDPPSVVPALVAIGRVLASPKSSARLARDAVGQYSVNPAAIAALRRVTNP